MTFALHRPTRAGARGAALTLVVALLGVGCSGGSDDAADTTTSTESTTTIESTTTESTTTTEATTSSTEATTTSTEATTSTTVTAESAPEDTANDGDEEGTVLEEDEELTDEDTDLIIALLETEVGRNAFIEGMMEESGLTRPQAECFVDKADIRTLLSIAGESDADISNETFVELFQVMDECDVDISALAG